MEYWLSPQVPEAIHMILDISQPFSESRILFGYLSHLSFTPMPLFYFEKSKTYRTNRKTRMIFSVRTCRHTQIHLFLLNDLKVSCRCQDISVPKYSRTHLGALLPHIGGVIKLRKCNTDTTLFSHIQFRLKWFYCLSHVLYY